MTGPRVVVTVSVEAALESDASVEASLVASFEVSTLASVVGVGEGSDEHAAVSSAQPKSVRERMAREGTAQPRALNSGRR